jgi:hypothetical protein
MIAPCKTLDLKVRESVVHEPSLALANVTRRRSLSVVDSSRSIEEAFACDQGCYALYHPPTFVHWFRRVEW